MKLENLGYRLNQRLNKGTICGSFNWKIRLQLSQTFGYDTGVLPFKYCDRNHKKIWYLEN